MAGLFVKLTNTAELSMAIPFVWVQCYCIYKNKFWSYLKCVTENCIEIYSYLFTGNEVNVWLNRQSCLTTASGAEENEVSVWNNANVSVTTGIHPVILKYNLQVSAEYRNFPLS